MSDPSTGASGSTSTSSSPSGGVSRFVGVGLSLVTGLVVFTVGVSLFPIAPPVSSETERRPPNAPAAAPAPAPEPAPAPAGAGGAPAVATTGPAAGDAAAPAVPVVAAPDGGARPAEPGRASAEKPSRGDIKPAAAPPAKAPGPRTRSEDAATADAPGPAPATSDAGTDGSANSDASGAGGAAGASASADDTEGSGAPAAPVADCTLSDKDLAREASKHNWPTVCAVADSKKAFLIIPVKGSVENAASELKRKPVREARVTLPSAEPQLSLKQYKLRRLGFRDLKIGPPDEGSGTRLRVRLMNGAGDPAFEIRDGYAKITVLTPAE